MHWHITYYAKKYVNNNFLFLLSKSLMMIAIEEVLHKKEVVLCKQYVEYNRSLQLSQQLCEKLLFNRLTENVKLSLQKIRIAACMILLSHPLFRKKKVSSWLLAHNPHMYWCSFFPSHIYWESLLCVARISLSIAKKFQAEKQYANFNFLSNSH